MSRKNSTTSSDKKGNNKTVIVVAVIGLFGTIVTAVFGYLASTKPPVINGATQTAEAKLTELAALPPTDIPIPEDLIPEGYVLYDNFDYVEIPDGRWARNENDVCNEGIVNDGFLWIQCETAIKDFRRAYSPTSGLIPKGVAISAEMISTYSLGSVRLNLDFHDINSSLSEDIVRRFSMRLYKNEIHIVEINPSDDWKDDIKVNFGIDSSQPHVLRFEYQDNKLKFFVDNDEIYEISPDFPPNYEYSFWEIEAYVIPQNQEIAKLNAKIFWVAILR